MKRWLIFCTFSLWLASQPLGFCAPTFKGAVEAYNSGKYAAALQDFKVFKASSPNNVLTRYYLALCHQAMNHTSEAREEYQFVSSYGDPTLKSHALKGLAQLGSMRSSSSGTSVAMSGGYSGGSAKPTTPAAPAATKVKKIFEFYADW